ncbi:UbiA family prenyltransferase [Rubrolithibacter danxiaensis]|uniref:UbiA family prenyltransferase n=1 Tax=Rubrolithibacter danxiaensis TaxID=3390805 RepID=UPI003BF87587
MQIIPTRSAWLHIRLFFSVFLLPVYVFALSQSPAADPVKALLIFIIWHFFVYPASNGYNSYFDKDEGSIALLEKPPQVDKSLYNFSILLDIIAVVLSFLVGIPFLLAVLIYGTLSKLYSHPAIRLKKYPVISFLIVFIFQGGFIYWTTYYCVSDLNYLINITGNFILGGLICSCLIGASYPLTQVYQHEEDAKRGDKTLSLVLGIKGSFVFSGLLFMLATVGVYFYWKQAGQLLNFYLFLLFGIPVAYTFIRWWLQVRVDKKSADFRNMTRMTVISSISMLLYFTLIWILKLIF